MFNGRGPKTPISSRMDFEFGKESRDLTYSPPPRQQYINLTAFFNSNGAIMPLPSVSHPQQPLHPPILPLIDDASLSTR